MTYDEVRKDWKVLFKEYGEAYDMTGGYVDQEDLELMLENPTKRQAKYCMMQQIGYWFQVGPDISEFESAKDNLQRLLETDPVIQGIAEKYGYGSDGDE